MAHLTVVASAAREQHLSLETKLGDHERLLQGYLDTHLTRNHAVGTLRNEAAFLHRWFASHGTRERPLFVWEAMEPIRGRERVVAYSKQLRVERGRAGSTVGGYLGILRRLFEFVLAWPYLPDAGNVTVHHRYGPIEQPVLIYDYPQHVWGGRREDAPLIRAELHAFYDLARKGIAAARRPATAARTYTMVVLAAESGLRIHELVTLDIKRDLLFGSGRLQTRFGKAAKGSGPRVRQTLFTPFAQATVRHYLDNVRPSFRRWSVATMLFLSEAGNALSTGGSAHHLRHLAARARTSGLRVPPRFGWHSLRRSFATLYAEEHQGSESTLLDMLGHENLSSLHRYIHHSRGYHDKAIDDVLVSLLPAR